MITRKNMSRTVIYTFLMIGALSALFPFYWMLSSSFKVTNDIFQYPPVIIPTRLTLESYTYLASTMDIPRTMLNTIFVTVTVVALNLIMSGMVSYALVKLRFPGRKLLFLLVLAFMMIPGQLLIVPQFILVGKLGLMNTYAAMILPSCLSSFSIFLLRQAMLSVPNDYIDAAKLDGCSHVYIYARIVMPLVAPMAVTVGLTNFFWTWNNYMWPMMVTSQRDDIQTLQVAIARYRTVNNVKWGAAMAGCVITALPILVVYLLVQKKYIESFMSAGIKG